MQAWYGHCMHGLKRANSFRRRPKSRIEKILPEVFNKVDAIVVPSIWLENSPLVIHEALQAGVLVITANVGGMAEYIHHEAPQLRSSMCNPDIASMDL